MKRQTKRNTNLMMIDYLISTKENLIDFVKAIILSFIFLFLFLALGEWKLRSMM